MVLVVGVLGMMALLDTANAKTATVRAREGATTLARHVGEAARSVPYGALVNESLVPRLQTQPGLASQGPGTEWKIERRGFVYTVSATVCSVDDPADGMGAHDVGRFCPESGPGGTTDRNPDDYKRVSIDVSWDETAAERRVRQAVLVNNPGSAGGPAVRELVPSSPAGPVITSDIGAVDFAASTSTPAASVSWLVDGVVRGSAAASGSSWSFSWPISGLVDGTHLVTAQAFDQSGLSGATRSVTMTLNRFAPAAPTGLAGGRNGDVVEFEWLPNTERDIVGYRVFRVVPGGTDVQVCALTPKMACQDTSPPSGTLSYYAVAADLDPNGQSRNGTPSPSVTVTTTNRAPHSPPSLTAMRADGVTTLNWTAASPADPDGDDIAFYRIYRDGTAFANRYDRTGLGTELSFVDSDGDGPHEYWVTAVDQQLAESAPVGPVAP